MVSEGIDTFLAFLRGTEQQYHIAEASEQEANDMTQDLLHSLELQEHNYHEYAKLSKELKKVRQQRRAAKDTLSETLPILTWIESNRAVIRGLEKLLGEVRKAEKRTDNRIYTPRAQQKGAV